MSGASDTSTLQQQCAQKGGTPSAACDHASSQGGCLFTTTVDGAQASFVYWYFFDSPDEIMASCAEAKVPYVSP